MMRVPLVRAAVALVSCLPVVASSQGRGAGAAAGSTVVQVVVPPVIGMPLNTALKAMSAVGLKCNTMNPDGGGVSPEYIVVRQAPSAGGGKVPFTTPCTLAVRAPAVTPNLLGRSPQDAFQAIKVAELKLRPTVAPSPDTALGSVIAQDPAPGAPIRPDRTIDVTFAGVPKVIGLSRADAVNAITRAHLQVAVDSRELASGNNDVVLAQAPAAGQPAKPQSVVNLTVARVIARVDVPMLMGRSLDAADRLLRDSQLVLGKVDQRDSPRPPGEVIDQRIRPPTRVPVGTAIDVLIARAMAFDMPNLVNSPIDDARAVVGKAGLALGPLKNTKAAGRPDTVVEQFPPAGTSVRAGDAVTFIVGRPIPLFRVPNLAGLRLGDVRKVLADSQFTLGPIAGRASDSNSGTVISQNPQAFERKPRNTPIAIDTAIQRIAVVPPKPLKSDPKQDPKPEPPKSDPRKPEPPKSDPKRSDAPASEATGQKSAPLRLARLTIVPDSSSTLAGDTVHLTAIAFLSDGSQVAATPTWRASSGAILADGRFIAGRSAARVIVTALQGGRSATAVVRVEEPPPPRPPWWLLVAGLAALSWLGRHVWKRLFPPPPPPPPPPPLAFTYDYKPDDAETSIQNSGRHGSDLALVSYAGESEHRIEPRDVKLFDEEKYS